MCLAVLTTDFHENISVFLRFFFKEPLYIGTLEQNTKNYKVRSTTIKFIFHGGFHLNFFIVLH